MSRLLCSVDLCKSVVDICSWLVGGDVLFSVIVVGTGEGCRLNIHRHSSSVFSFTHSMEMLPNTSPTIPLSTFLNLPQSEGEAISTISLPPAVSLPPASSLPSAIPHPSTLSPVLEGLKQEQMSGEGYR